MNRIVRQITLASFLMLNLIFQVSAHRPDQNYVYLGIYEDGMTCRVEMKKPDIQKVFGYSIAQGEIPSPQDPRMQEIIKYILKNLSFRQGSRNLELMFKSIDQFEMPSGDFLLFRFDILNIDPLSNYLDVYDNIFLSELDGHESFLIIEQHWKTGVLNNESLPSLIFGPSSKNQRLDLEEGSVMTGFIAMIKSGIYHIWIGLDHILFLIALLIPAVIIFKTDQPKRKLFGLPYMDYEPKKNFRTALLSVVKIITIFTLAHSITLSLAALGIIILPSRLVESIIALSIAMAAYHNISPFLFSKEWLIVLIFGLFHGFGFASVLAEQSRGGDYLVYSLVGFNLGVEIGQLTIIFIVFPILYFLSKWSRYNLILVGFSLLLICISLYWIVERVFEIDLQFKTWILESLGLI